VRIGGSVVVRSGRSSGGHDVQLVEATLTVASEDAEAAVVLPFHAAQQWSTLDDLNLPRAEAHLAQGNDAQGCRGGAHALPMFEPRAVT
jgi:hypothetical protein